jgi:UDP-glucose 4-epimerase
MKKILITGANSYIGTSFEKYISDNYKDNYVIDTIDIANENWSCQSFSDYDCIFHVAGIAHSDSGKIGEEKEKLYYAVNTDLTIEVARKAKLEGVKQFIFMSSAIVYGKSASIGKHKVITRETSVNPDNCYGDSKVQAEKGLQYLNDDDFKIVIIRSPMVYGKGSKGNYQLLVKIALKSFAFPYIKNERSMLYIENLSEFVRLIVDNEEQGIFWPQNEEYSNTSELIKMIAEAHGKNVRLVKGFEWMLKIMSHITKLVDKAFGNLCYEKSISQYCQNYRIYNLKESIKKAEDECE